MNINTCTSLLALYIAIVVQVCYNVITVKKTNNHRKGSIIMKMFVVRLHNYNGSIIDGEVFEAVNAEEALKMYKARHLQRRRNRMVKSNGAATPHRKD